MRGHRPRGRRFAAPLTAGALAVAALTALPSAQAHAAGGDWSDPQWIRVDLGSRTTFHHVQLQWEASCAKAYTVQTSDDGQNWQTVRTVPDGNGAVDDFDVTGTGRHGRVNGTARGTGYGYSRHKFGVHG